MVQLLTTRKLDKSDKGFENWTFMSVMTWGEIAEGLWILTISDKVTNVFFFSLASFNFSFQTGPKENYGYVGETTLILHGTKRMPKYRKLGPRKYDFDYNKINNNINDVEYDEYNYNY